MSRKVKAKVGKGRTRKSDHKKHSRKSRRRHHGGDGEQQSEVQAEMEFEPEPEVDVDVDVQAQVEPMPQQLPQPQQMPQQVPQADSVKSEFIEEVSQQANPSSSFSKATSSMKDLGKKTMAGISSFFQNLFGTRKNLPPPTALSSTTTSYGPNPSYGGSKKRKGRGKKTLKRRRGKRVSKTLFY